MLTINRILLNISLAGISLTCPAIVLAQTVAITEFPIPASQNGEPNYIAVGPDGALWFTETNGQIGRLTTSGAYTEYPLPTASSYPYGITAGPDAAIWFTEASGNNIGRITMTGAVTEYPLPTAASQPTGITVGPDGALWFPEGGSGKLGRITTTGSITEYPEFVTRMPAQIARVLYGYCPCGITAGPDGALWVSSAGQIWQISTSAGAVTGQWIYLSDLGAGITAGPDGALWFAASNSIGRFTTDGKENSFQAPSGANGITTGPDGAVWFTTRGNEIGRITPAGVISAYAVPTANSDPTGIVAGPDGALWFTELTGGKIGRAAVVQPNVFLPWEHSATPVEVYWQFADGTPFGNYSVLEASASSQTALIDHADLGYEFVQAGSTAGSLYLYDFASGHWWYTSSSLFPSLYDFTLNTWLYYFPVADRPGSYTASPRYFGNLMTGKIFTI